MKMPDNEDQRLKILKSYGIMDTDEEMAYDDITYLASYICDTPIALISLVDEERQWFKSRVGIEAKQTPRDQAFCAHAICKSNELMIVPDATKDPRFILNPLVTEDPKIRFYAGAPLRTHVNDVALGTLCVIDTRPRRLNQEQLFALAALSRQVISQFDLRRSIMEIYQNEKELKKYKREKKKAWRKELEAIKNL